VGTGAVQSWLAGSGPVQFYAAALGLGFGGDQLLFAKRREFLGVFAKPRAGGASGGGFALEDFGDGGILVTADGLGERTGVFEQGFETDQGLDSEAEPRGLDGQTAGGVLDVGDAVKAVPPLALIGLGGTGGDPRRRLKAFEQRTEAGYIPGDLLRLGFQLPIRRQALALHGQEKDECCADHRIRQFT
jgi:hypothetical protein